MAKKDFVKVRVLVDVPGFSANDVALLSAEAARAAVAGGWGDDTAAAVEYAEAEGAVAREPEAPVAEAAAEPAGEDAA